MSIFVCGFVLCMQVKQQLKAEFGDAVDENGAVINKLTRDLGSCVRALVGGWEC